MEPTLAKGHLPFPLRSAEDARRLFATVQSQALDRCVTLRAPPPEPTTCCGRGCNGCVWEGFMAATVFWYEDAVDALQQGN
jgi:hypothetical protein